VSFKYLRDSVDSQGLKRCNISRVEGKKLVRARMPPNGGVVPVA
jgi:hypothetical protein